MVQEAVEPTRGLRNINLQNVEQMWGSRRWSRMRLSQRRGFEEVVEEAVETTWLRQCGTNRRFRQRGD
jgi:hypothetical protein